MAPEARYARRIQASIFGTQGFDVGFVASGEASDAVFDQLALFGIEAPNTMRFVVADPIEELGAEPLPEEE